MDPVDTTYDNHCKIELINWYFELRLSNLIDFRVMEIPFVYGPAVLNILHVGRLILQNLKRMSFLRQRRYSCANVSHADIICLPCGVPCSQVPTAIVQFGNAPRASLCPQTVLYSA